MTFDEQAVAQAAIADAILAKGVSAATLDELCRYHGAVTNSAVHAIICGAREWLACEWLRRQGQ